MSEWIWIDGAVVPAERATVAATDRGLLLGEGVFETIALVDGQPFALTRHLERLNHSARIVGLTLPWSDDHLRAACAATLAAARAGGDQEAAQSGRLRITITGGPGPLTPLPGERRPTLLVTVTTRRAAAAAAAPTAAVTVSPWPVNEHSPVVGAKTTSRLEYTLALAAAQRHGADEAVLLNTQGMLAEATSANVFLVVAGRLSTPSLATGCLGGVTRSLITELVDVAERDDLTADDLRLAPEAFLTSTTRGVQPITSVDGVALRAAPGPLTTAARTALDTLRTATLAP
jgi:branched-chain amino acid aminotransferase